MTLNERTEAMIDRYGETVTLAKAGKIINRDPSTIRRMLADGRLESACAGTMVDMYSIARYICAPAELDTEARIRRSGRVCRWAV